MQLYRFLYSPYVWKVRALLDLARADYRVIDVPYCDRRELLSVSGDIQVPVLVLDDGRVLSGSRTICNTLIAEDARFARFLPSPLEGPISAYADWAEDDPDESIWFLSAPGIRDSYTNAHDRAFFTLVKERKYGVGALERWAERGDELADELRAWLAPTARTLARVPFVFGDAPTLADAALYGQLCMLSGAAPARVAALDPALLAWMERLQKLGVTRPESRRA
jgi:glutathione S-transferase